MAKAARKTKVIVAPPPVSEDRAPAPQDNPRHAVWIDDAKGLRKITARNPGEERISVEGVLYQHTRELRPEGPWVYTRVQ